MTNRLLARTGEVVKENEVNRPPKIGLLGSWTENEAIEYDFQIPQELQEDPPATGGKYGFNNQYSQHFLHLQNPDILTIRDPEEKSALERWEIMRKQEDTKFDKEWYLADLVEPPPELEDIMNYTLPALGQPFSAAEQSLLRNLGNKDCTRHFENTCNSSSP